jgi:hypothetical protein
LMGFARALPILRTTVSRRPGIVWRSHGRLSAFVVPASRHLVSVTEEREMALDTDRIDEAVLALLYLGLHEECRAWKGFDWAAMDRLHKKGMIENPVSKAKSVVFTAEGLRRSRELFEQMFKKKSVTGSERA